MFSFMIKFKQFATLFLTDAENEAVWVNVQGGVCHQAKYINKLHASINPCILAYFVIQEVDNQSDTKGLKSFQTYDMVAFSNSCTH